MKSLKPLALLLPLLGTSASFGAIPLTAVTDEFGNFLTGVTYSGTGTVQANADTANGDDVFIQGISTGTFVFAPSNFDQTKFLAPTGITVTVNIVGGTGDIVIGAPDGLNGIRIVNLVGSGDNGVTSITVGGTFSNRVGAAGTTSDTIPQDSNLGMGGGIRPLPIASWSDPITNLAITFGGLGIYNSDGTVFTPGPSPLPGAGFLPNNWADGFSPTPTGGNFDPVAHIQNMQAYDIDGDGGVGAYTVGDGIIQEVERTYFDSVTFEVTGTNLGSSDNGGYRVTFDARQFQDTFFLPIPEPSTSLLIMGALLVLVPMRRR